MLFRTAYDVKKRIHCRCGCNTIPECVLAVKDNGVMYLKEVGKINIYKKIQSHRDSCDMALISSKLDPTMLSNAMSSFRVEDVDQAVINDLTAAPVTLGDALNSVKAAENLFNGLPLEVRKEFNFSTAAFIKSAGSDRFMKIFGGNKVDQVLPIQNINGAVPVSVPGSLGQALEATVNQPVMAVAAPVKKKKKKKVIEVEVDDDDE